MPPTRDKIFFGVPFLPDAASWLYLVATLTFTVLVPTIFRQCTICRFLCPLNRSLLRFPIGNGSLQERDEARGEYPYFEDYIGGHGLEEVLESETLYNEWVNLQPQHTKKELELGIYRVRAYPKSDDSIGCFTKTAK